MVKVVPSVNDTVEVGDICVFTNGNKFEIGRILQFSHYQEKWLQLINTRVKLLTQKGKIWECCAHGLKKVLTVKLVNTD